MHCNSVVISHLSDIDMNAVATPGPFHSLQSYILFEIVIKSIAHISFLDFLRIIPGCILSVEP